MRLGHLSDRQASVVGGVTGLLVPSEPRLPAGARARVLERVARFVALQIENLPTYLRVPYLVAVTGFQWLPIVRFGRRFLGLPLESQRACLAFWSDAPLAPMRDFVRLLRSCALLAYYDDPEVRPALRARHSDEARAETLGTWDSP